MVDERRSPKRARIDNGPPNADAIAQTNSTLQHFLGGNRQNRWMHGYSASSTKDATTKNGGAAGSTARTTPAANTALPNNPALNPHAEDTAQTARYVNPAQAHEDDLQRHQADTIVQYESPTNTTIPSSNPGGTFGKLASTRTSISMAPDQPGLPSPAASDDNGASPSMHAPPDSLRMTVSMPSQTVPRQLGRPPRINHAHPVRTGSPAQTITPAPTHMRQKSRSSSATAGNLRMSNVLPSTAQPALVRPPSVPVVPSNSAAPLQGAIMRQSEHSMLSREMMAQRFKSFKTSKGLNTVDSGRLTLLRDAIDHYDLAYIVLSQIHALTKTPDLIPNSAQGLDSRSLQYLNYLICSTDQLSPDVLSWLSNFPAPIVKIYSSAECAAIYEPVVQQVTEFLRLLPLHWDRVATESRNREAPPLVEDIVEAFGIHSPVFHRTAFRAICRLILTSDKFSHAEKGIDRLEYLHSLDQVWFNKFQRRTSAEKLGAYRAFLSTKLAWKNYEPILRAHDKQQQELNAINGVKLPPPPQFMYTAESFAPFQLTRGGNWITPTAGAVASEITIQQPAMAPATQAASNRSHSGRQPSITQQFQELAARITGVNPGTLQQAPSSRSYFFPHEGEMPRAQPTNPDPSKSALHQAHLRSPTLGPVHTSTQLSPSSLYRYVMGYALSPQRLNKFERVKQFTFRVPQDSLDKIPPTVPSKKPGEPPSRALTESSQLYRLRCAACPQSGFPVESAWAVADNYWPDELFLECNGTILEPRRKLQHGRHVPIDLTHLIKSEENNIMVVINRTSTDSRPFDYVVAVEIVGVKSHETIKKDIQQVTQETTLKAIQKSLASSGDTEDLAVTSSNLTIRLFDPYSNSKIFATPVRGSACAHKDCFDLETFLRMCKRERPGWPTVVDCWRCPLCRGDVRPHTLVMDGFLNEVRSELEKRGLLKTREIVVEADGTWKSKAEEMNGVRSPSLEREERSGSEKTRSASASASASKKVVEVIEID